MTSSMNRAVKISDSGNPVASRSSSNSIGVVMTQSMYRTYQIERVGSYTPFATQSAPRDPPRMNSTTMGVAPRSEAIEKYAIEAVKHKAAPRWWKVRAPTGWVLDQAMRPRAESIMTEKTAQSQSDACVVMSMLDTTGLEERAVLPAMV